MTKPLVRRIETPTGHKRFWDHPIHNAYAHMKARCYSDTCREYKHYGDRGITVCDEWLSDKWVFVAWAYEAGWTTGLSLNRINNDGPYAPWNCEWTTQREQNHNRRNNILLDAFGEIKTAKKWSEDSRCSVSYRRLMRRIQQWNWDHEQAITTPPLQAGGGRRTK